VSQIADIEKQIRACRSRIPALRAETRSCMSFGPAGEMEVSDPQRLKALNDEIERLEALIAHNSEVLARLQAILGDRTIAELEREKVFAANRIEGIKAELDYDLKRLVGRAIGISDDYLIVGDHLFHQAGRQTVSKVLKGEEFAGLQLKAESEVAALQEKLAACSDMVRQAQSAFADYRPVGGIA